MMLKRNIKIISVGLLSLLFLGLVYSLLSSKPEIISDESLKVEEPAIPGLRSQIERSASVDNSQAIPMIKSQEEASLSDAFIEPSIATLEGAETLEESQVTEAVIEDNYQSPEMTSQESAAPSEYMQATSAEAQQVNASSSVSPFRDDALKLSDYPDVDDKSVAIIPDATGFLDLNLEEVQPSIPDMVLIEGDQLIVDDINVGLTKFKAIDSDRLGDEKEIATDTSEVNEMAANDIKNEDSADVLGEATALNGGSDVPAAELASVKPSVFSVPEIDQQLMQGDGEISKQYQQTMAKLISINAKLREADEENAGLQAHFNMAVSQNRQLAQIIRDIDLQIKSYTLTN